MQYTTKIALRKSLKNTLYISLTRIVVKIPGQLLRIIKKNHYIHYELRNIR